MTLHDVIELRKGGTMLVQVPVRNKLRPGNTQRTVSQVFYPATGLLEEIIVLETFAPG